MPAPPRHVTLGLEALNDALPEPPVAESPSACTPCRPERRCLPDHLPRLKHARIRGWKTPIAKGEVDKAKIPHATEWLIMKDDMKEQTTLKSILAAVALAASSGTAVATNLGDIGPTDPSAATFFSDTVLRNAVTTISQMQEPELRAFARYLAECHIIPRRDDASKHLCEVAQDAYEIEFGHPFDDPKVPPRDLDRWIVARSTHVTWNENHPKGWGTADEIVSDVSKEMMPVTTIWNATQQRFRALRLTSSQRR